MSSQAKVPLVIYELPLTQKKAIATTFLTAQFLSKVFDPVTDDPQDLAFQSELENALSKFLATKLCHRGITSEIKVNLVLLNMLTLAKEAKEE